MSGRMKVGIAGVVIGLVLLILGVPIWAVVLVFAAALAIPVVGYLTLDKSQRARLNRIRSRRQIGR